MTQPTALQKEEPLFWSTGLGTDVWQMFCAARDGDVEKIKKLLIKDHSLVRGAYDYRTPMSFAVANDRLEVAEYLLQHGASPVDPVPAIRSFKWRATAVSGLWKSFSNVH
jgi:hypothetical protein